jgi:P27 family predicted phage terminase small subunit
MPAVKPAALKLVTGRGNGKDAGGRKVKTPPAFRRIPPTAPSWLGPVAAAEWSRVVAELQRLDLLKETDGPSLAAYCETWAEFVAATLELQAHGSLTIDAKQGEIPHPAVAIRRNAGRELRSWANQFGLTPSSEQMLGRDGGDGEGEANPFAQ